MSRKKDRIRRQIATAARPSGTALAGRSPAPVAIAKDITVAGMDLTGHTMWDGVPTRANAASARLSQPGISSPVRVLHAKWKALASHPALDVIQGMYGDAHDAGEPVSGSLDAARFCRVLDGTEIGTEDHDADASGDADGAGEADGIDKGYVGAIRTIAGDIGSPPAKVHVAIMLVHAQSPRTAPVWDSAGMLPAGPLPALVAPVTVIHRPDVPDIRQELILHALTDKTLLIKGIPDLTFAEADALARELVGVRISREDAFAKAGELAREMVEATRH